MVAERLERGKNKKQRKLFVYLFGFIRYWFHRIFTLFFGARAIAIAMGDIHLDKLLRVISFSFILMPFYL